MSQHTDHTVDTPSFAVVLTRAICWFAAFPYAAYTQLATPLSRVRVAVNGIAVIISPLVFAMALVSNGSRLVGHSPYLYLLPVVVFAIEWLLIALSYRAMRSALLVLIRIVILIVSITMAIFAGVLAEGTSLLQRLHRAEDEVTMQSNTAQILAVRLNAVEEQIAHNEKALMARDAIESERLDALRLREMECFGRGGLDTKSNVIIKGGGKCGENARTHGINAQAAQAQLDKLKVVEKETQALAVQRDQLRSELRALLQSQRSPSDSVGSVLRALDKADIALWFRIASLVAIVLATEAAALVLSKVPAGETLELAVQASDEIDRIRLLAWRDASLAQVARARAVLRAQAADGLAPLDITLKPGLRASTPPRPRPASEPQSEEATL